MKRLLNSPDSTVMYSSWITTGTYLNDRWTSPTSIILPPGEWDIQVSARFNTGSSSWGVGLSQDRSTANFSDRTNYNSIFASVPSTEEGQLMLSYRVKIDTATEFLVKLRPLTSTTSAGGHVIAKRIS